MSSTDASVVICGATNPGHVRDGNEDYFLVSQISTGHSSAPAEATLLPLTPNGVLIVVCDGMGGAAAGEVASRLACETLVRTVHEASHAAFESSGAALLASAVRRTNRVVFEQSKRVIEQQGMGTTCTAALVLEHRLFVAQVGDSRAYRLRSGNLLPLTRDQSLDMELIDAGMISAESNGRDTSVILQAVGVGAKISPAISEVDLEPGDRILLCSDGLHGVVPEARIKTLLTQTDQVSPCVRTLVHAALEAGGPDNITAVLARFGGHG